MLQEPTELATRAAHGLAGRTVVGQISERYCRLFRHDLFGPRQELAKPGVGSGDSGDHTRSGGWNRGTRKRLNAPTPRVRYDAGHTMYIPANTDIWAFGDSTNIVRGVRMRFNLSVVDGLLQDECDRLRWSEPVLLLYDDRIREIAKLISQECHTEGERPPLYGESLATALLACLFQSSDVQKKVSQLGLTESS